MPKILAVMCSQGLLKSFPAIYPLWKVWKYMIIIQNITKVPNAQRLGAMHLNCTTCLKEKETSCCCCYLPHFLFVNPFPYLSPNTDTPFQNSYHTNIVKNIGIILIPLLIPSWYLTDTNLNFRLQTNTNTDIISVSGYLLLVSVSVISV